MAVASWGKISEFVLNVIQLQRTVETLKTQNDQLRDEITRLQRQVDDQGGQLKILLTFIQTSLKDRVESSAERAVARMIERLNDFRGDPPDDPR